MSMARAIGGAVAIWASAVVFVGAPALAQDAMGQGEASINVRSDVKLGIKGTRGTSSENLQQLTDVVSDQMPALRKCYADLVAKRPSTVGALAIRITLDRGKGAAGLEVKETGGTEPDLTKCVRRVLDRAPFKKVGRPAAAIVTLDFQNSRAKGQVEMGHRREEAASIDVSETPDGTLEASWGTPDGLVNFRVEADAKGSREAVEVALRTLRASFAGFLDCRRRSQKDGLSPAGDVDVDLRLTRGGGSAKIVNSTVAHKRAVPCLERTFRKLKFDHPPPGKRVKVRITFGE